MKLPHQIEKELAGEIRGDIVTDDAARHVYATAACIYRIMPLAIARPRDTEDVAAIVRYAADNGIPITPRGGGSGVAGHSIGPGIVIDFAPHMRSILSVGDDWVEVQPGVVLDKLNARLAKIGKRFGPDPSSGAYCTLGGMIANNSSGARSIKFGSTRRHIIDLEIVTASGEIVNTDSMSNNVRARHAVPLRSDGWLGEIQNNLSRLIESNREIIDSRRPKVTKNSSGYELWDIIASNGAIDPARIIAGSEGTLAVVTKARLKVVPLASHVGVTLVAFDSLERAMSAAPLLRESDPSAIEILGDTFLDLLRKYRPDMAGMLPPPGCCMLLVEIEAVTRDELESKLEKVSESALKAGSSSLESASDKTGAARLWGLRKAGSPIIGSIPGPKRPTRFVEDMVVPPERLSDFVQKFAAILRKHDCMAPVIGHAGDGNIHVNPILDLSDPAASKKLERIAGEVYSLVGDFDGSLSGEHGDGRLRAPYLRNHFGGLYGVFGEIKYLFDPKGILNPGVIIGDGKITDHMRPAPFLIDMAENAGDSFSRERILRCHGCGLCRSVCPVFEITGADENSPRGKIALAGSIARGNIDAGIAAKDPAARRIFELCLSCARCEAGCPSLAHPCVEASYFRSRLAQPSSIQLIDNALRNPRAWMPVIARMGRSGEIMQSGAGRFLESEFVARTFGVNPEISPPKIQTTSLNKLAEKYASSGLDCDAIYFPGCHAIFIDPVGTGIAAIRALEAVGLKVSIPTFACCGLPRIVSGDIEGARAALWNAIQPLLNDREIPIVTSCPSCEMILKGEIFHSELPELRNISSRVVGVESLLWKMLGNKNLKPLDKPLKAALHFSCHQRQSGNLENVADVLEKIPGLELEILPDACCGMGGTFGMKYRNREIARETGKDLFEALRKSGAGIVLSDCGVCRTAISKVKPAAHPISLIASCIDEQQ